MKTKLLIHFTLLLILMITPYSIQAQDRGAKMNSKEVKVLIDSLSSALRRHYIYADKAEIMISSIKKKYKSGTYNDAKDRIALAMQLHDDLQEAHKDGHMRITYSPQMATRLETKLTVEEEKQEQERKLRFAHEINFAFIKTETLPGNIGYVRWDGFMECIEEAKPTMNSAFQFISNCKAVIVDMRYNGGGSPDMVTATQNYFFNERVHLNDIIYRSRDTVVRYSDPTKTTFKLNMPVYILTSHRTFSGAEDFTYGMQQTNRATIVGDTTGGGAHPTGPVSIGQGFVAGIPTGCAPKGKDWEGVGVAPTVVVPSEQALIKAQKLALTDLLSKATDDREKASINWQLNNLKSSERSSTIDPLLVKSYTGVYDGGLDFYMKDQSLFCKNAERGNNIFELKPISDALFLLDENVQVEFEKDASGVCSKMKMHWKSGMITEKRKMQ